jgi:alpha-1,2-mannosyltransferase
MNPAGRLTLQAYRVVAFGLGLWLLLGVLPTIAPKLTSPAWDGGLGWYAAKHLLDGTDPVDPDELHRSKLTGLGFPPTVGVWFLPFASLPYEQMGTDVRLLTIFVLGLHLLLLTLELGATAPIALATLLFGYVFSRQFFLVHLDVAQISEFIAAWILLTWFFLRRGEDVAAGICLGLASTFKLFPVVIGLFFLASRRWRAAIAAAATYLLIFAVVTVRWGWRLWPHFYTSDHALVRDLASNAHNGSLYGIFVRAFHRICVSREPPTRAATILYVVVSLLLVAAFFWLSRRAARRPDDWELSFGFAATLAPFLHPVMWEHYSVLFMLPIAIIVARMGPPQPWWQRGLLALMVLATSFFMTVPMHYRSLFLEKYWEKPIYHAYLHFYIVANWLPPVLLMATFAFLLVRSNYKRT